MTSATVAILGNPRAGKDVRRLFGSGNSTDTSKITTMRLITVAALETGASNVLLMPDRNGLAERAIEGLGSKVGLIDIDPQGSSQDTTRSARWVRDRGIGSLVALGGDGTSRDVVMGWNDAPLIALSTGTNNVFPTSIDGTSAGTAAALVAMGRVALEDVARRAKRIQVDIEDESGSTSETALVDLAFVLGDFIGSRAVTDPSTITTIVAAIASPASTGLSSVVGRITPVDRWQSGGVVVELGSGETSVRAPLVPGSFDTVFVRSVRTLEPGERVSRRGRCILALDGERHVHVSASASVTYSIDQDGPWLIDVPTTLTRAASSGVFARGSCRPTASDIDSMGHSFDSYASHPGKDSTTHVH